MVLCVYNSSSSSELELELEFFVFSRIEKTKNRGSNIVYCTQNRDSRCQDRRAARLFSLCLAKSQFYFWAIALVRMCKGEKEIALPQNKH